MANKTMRLSAPFTLIKKSPGMVALSGKFHFSFLFNDHSHLSKTGFSQFFAVYFTFNWLLIAVYFFLMPTYASL